jgi:hypothetical protein
MAETKSTAPATLRQAMLEVGSGFTLLTQFGIDPILAFVPIVGAVCILRR